MIGKTLKITDYIQKLRKYQHFWSFIREVFKQIFRQSFNKHYYESCIVGKKFKNVYNSSKLALSIISF